MIIRILIFTLILATIPTTIYAQSPAPRHLPLDATAAILVEQTTGRVLYAHNAFERRYPASMSKMITALVVVEHLGLNDIIVVGPEIRNMPAGYTTNLHAEGETITVHVLLKALMIRSGNESGRTLALEVIRRQTGRADITYNEAKPLFSALLNQKARELGVRDTTFNNPYGLHSDTQHFTTAYDLALVARAYMNHPVLAEIAGMNAFEGNSLGGLTHPEANVRQYNWVNHNRMLPGADLGHPFVRGIKTGFTTPAGHCFAGSAYNNGLDLITIVFNSQDPGRWQDTRMLMDFGFNNFAFRDIAHAEQTLETVYIENPRLGDMYTLEVVSTESYRALLSHAEYDAITRVITYDPLLLVEDSENGTHLRTPIYAGEAIGIVTYLVDGETIFYAPIIAARDVHERTFDSDMDYYIALFFDNIFSTRALPYWFGFFGVLFGILGWYTAIKIHLRTKKFERWQQPERRRPSRYNRPPF